MKKWLFLIAVLLSGLHWLFFQKPIHHAPGVLVATAPEQIDIENPSPFPHKDFIITPLAHYDIRALVLSQRGYRFDRSAAISPLDLALGWQQMSDQSIIDQLSIRQSGRFYSFRPKSGRNFPITPQLALLQSANTHLIPSSPIIAKELKRIRKGDIVRLQGYLVSISRKRDGFNWSSSLTRADSGGGACEVMWVTEVSRNY